MCLGRAEEGMKMSYQVDTDPRVDMIRGLLAKGHLLLKVKIRTEDDAEEIIRWMYAPHKPMQAELLEIAWDKELVDKDVFDALRSLEKALSR